MCIDIDYTLSKARVIYHTVAKLFDRLRTVKHPENVNIFVI